MSRETWVRRNGKLVLKHLAPPRDTGRVNGVISDTMDAMVHPVTGKLMDSKSRFRQATRAAGCVEVGNDAQRDTRQISVPNLTRDIAEAIKQLGG